MTKATLRQLYNQKYKKRFCELLRYGLVGVSTTLINIATYQGLMYFLDYKIANIIALLVSKTYGYLANKNVVFRSHTDSFSSLILELIRFVFARGFTAVVDYFGLILAVEVFGFDKIISKYAIQIIVIILNYVLGKFMVFRAGKQKDDRIDKEELD